MHEESLPKPFVQRRLHSLMGFWLSIFLIDHLFTNSQAALLIGSDGRGFIDSVNRIHNIPYLPVVEILILAVPILIHGLFGIKYALEARTNSAPTDGSLPSLDYRRNRAFTWQRLTAWLVLIGIAAHIVHMRFLNYPTAIERGSETLYSVDITPDPGLYTLADRLDVTLQNPPRKQHVVATAKDFGTAELLIVRNAFKSPPLMILYTAFVIAACYHAYNGLATSLITWGVTLTKRAQTIALGLSHALMTMMILLGLAAIWLTYWVNLKS